MTGEPQNLARAFAQFARDLLAQESVQATLEGITTLAVTEIEGCEYAAVSMVKGGVITTRAATDVIAEQVDQSQYRTGQGPCLEAIWEREVFSIDDMSEETRWPDFATEARELGVRSMLTFQLFTHRDTLGALNLHAPKPRAFDIQARETGKVLAAHAAVALASAQNESNLREGIRTRQRIGEATGILIERYKITDRQAFALLAQASQNLNVKLRDLAEEIVETGAVPEPAPPRERGPGQGQRRGGPH